MLHCTRLANARIRFSMLRFFRLRKPCKITLKITKWRYFERLCYLKLLLGGHSGGADWWLKGAVIGLAADAEDDTQCGSGAYH